MACMCGDICCPSCGLSQGNSRCIICHAWTSEGCEHVTEEGFLKEEYKQQAEEILQQENNAWDNYYSDQQRNEETSLEHDDFLSDMQEEPNDSPEY